MADNTSLTTTTAASTTAVAAPQPHVMAIAYARVLGPKRTKDPSGLPAFFTTGVFDSSIETPQEAAARAIGQRWHKIDPNPADWKIILDEDVIQPQTGARIKYDRVVVLQYLPDQALYKSEGIDPTKIPLEHRESWYLTKHWKAAETNAGSQTQTDSAQGT